MAGAHPIFAHAGHVLVDVPLFLGPVILLGLALWLHARWVRHHEEDRR
jgi:hypothetical protein